MTPLEAGLSGYYEYWLVMFSVGVACLASYAALSLATRAGAAPENERLPWLSGGALMMGLAIWSMHFTGMLAFRLPIPVGYDPLLTLLSGLMASLGALVALRTACAPDATRRNLLRSGSVMGLGIVLMHYTGMAAMRMEPGIEYRLLPFVASIVIAMAASVGALLLIRHAIRPQGRFWQRPLAALAMGLAISGMHYTGMAAARFAPGSYCSATAGIDGHWLAAGVLICSVLAVAVALVTAVFDARLQRRTQELAQRLIRANGELADLHDLDPLTRLHNRNHVDRQLARALRRAELEGHTVALLYLDLDGFSPVNRSFGHGAGDQVLREVAARLRRLEAPHSLLARVGNDEYVMLIEPAPDADGLSRLASRLLEQLRPVMRVHGQELRLTGSLGIACAPEHDSGPQLVQKAQMAMAEAQRSGRNTYRTYRPEYDTGDREALEMIADLRRALATGSGLQLHYQPKVGSRDGRLHSVEALLRWQHPRHGAVSPERFVPLAERHGLIGELGDWVLREACRQSRAWLDAGLELRIAINISPRQFREPGLLDKILHGLRLQGLPPAALMLEITETSVMEDQSLARSTIAALAAAGLAIAIDDFGTGYSSLSRLRELPVQELKLDRSFLADLGSKPSAQAVIEAVVQLAHSLGMALVVEGVETARQAALLRDLQCDALQGFHYSPAVPGNELPRLTRLRGLRHPAWTTADAA